MEWAGTMADRTARNRVATVETRFRLRDDLRERLIAAAKEAKRPMTAEIAERLEASFRGQQLMIDAMQLKYGREVSGLALVVADVMSAVTSARPFHLQLGPGTAPWMYQEMVRGVVHALQALAPGGDVIEPPGVNIHFPPEVLARLGEEATALARAEHERRVAAERKLGVTTAERRLAQLADPKRPDVARDLLNADFADRPLRKRPDADRDWTGAPAAKGAA